MSPGPLVIRWHNDIGDLSPPPSGCQLMSGKNKLRALLSSQTSSIRAHLAWPGAIRDQVTHLTSERDLSLGIRWSLGAMIMWLECASCWITLHSAPGAPHKWSVLASREPKCLFYAYCICLEMTIGELHTNTICIKFTSNNGSSLVNFGYFCIWYSDFVWFGGIISILMKYKFHLQIGLCCKIRLHCPPPAQPRQVTLLTPLTPLRDRLQWGQSGKLWTFWYRLLNPDDSIRLLSLILL